jgi:hypothetical protein
MAARISILHPEFSWLTALTIEKLQKRLSTAPTTPHLRGVAPFWLQRFVGFIHQRIVVKALHMVFSLVWVTSHRTNLAATLWIVIEMV